MNTAPGPMPTQELTVEQKTKAWHDLQEQLAELKEKERKARKVAFDAAFARPKEGTNTFDFGNGYKFKVQYNVERKFIVPHNLSLPEKAPGKPAGVNEAVDHMVERMRRASNEGPFYAERLVKWEPKISNTEYKDLPEPLRKIVDEYIVTDYKFAAPKVETPKAKD